MVRVTSSCAQTVNEPDRLGVSSRTMQIVLGVLWILDAALQAQPAMFTRFLANTVIARNALNQPTPIASSITTVAHSVSHGVGTWNYAFVTVQLAIGIGLLVPRLVRPALIVMFGWCLGVWWFGEGFGGLLTGTATPLTGAPGAVVLYALVGMLVWPRGQTASPIREEADAGLVGPASSALAQGPLGVGGALAVWSGFWFLSAGLWLLPANRAVDAASTAIRGMAVGQPGWYGHFLSAVANGLSGHGVLVAWLLALVSLVIGLGPVVTRRPIWFLVAGAALQLAFWITGMALGGILTGTATDPNIGPLVVLLAVGMLPTVASDNAVSPLRRAIRTPSFRSPGRRGCGRHRRRRRRRLPVGGRGVTDLSRRADSAHPDHRAFPLYLSSHHTRWRDGCAPVSRPDLLQLLGPVPLAGAGDYRLEHSLGHQGDRDPRQHDHALGHPRRSAFCRLGRRQPGHHPGVRL